MVPAGATTQEQEDADEKAEQNQANVHVQEALAQLKARPQSSRSTACHHALKSAVAMPLCRDHANAALGLALPKVMFLGLHQTA